LRKELAQSEPFSCIDLPLVLGAAHNFLTQFPIDVQGGSEDSPLRAVNTLIHELVCAVDSSILQSVLKGLPTHSKVHMLVYQHTNKHESTDNIEAGCIPMTGNKSCSSTSAELAQILQRITAPGSSAGSSFSLHPMLLNDLREFKKTHPDVDVLSHLPPCSAAFKDFLEAALCNGVYSRAGHQNDENDQGKSSASGETKENSHPVDAIGERLRNLQARLKMNPGNAPLGSSNVSANAPERCAKITQKKTSPNTHLSTKTDSSAGSSNIDIQNLKERLAKLKSGQLS